MFNKILCFWELVKKELFLFFKEFPSRLLDVSIVLCSWVLVFGYLMTQTGLKSSYGSFILVGSIASFGLFETIWRAMILAQDAVDKKLSNLFLLPIPTSYVFIAIATAWAICTGLIALCLFPLGKLLLWDQFNFTHFSLVKFLLIFITSNVFYGFFALWIASIVSNLRNTSWIWSRLVNPLYMFCGFFYTWQSAYDLSPIVGYLHFLNPLLFVLEGTKASLLGQEGFLPFSACFWVLWVIIALLAYDAIRRFKKRLDLI